MCRMTVPAVGYAGAVLPLVDTGTMTPVTVSPATRAAVKWPVLFVPVVFSVPDDVPLTDRCVLPAARPDTVLSLA